MSDAALGIDALQEGVEGQVLHLSHVDRVQHLLRCHLPAARPLPASGVQTWSSQRPHSWRQMEADDDKKMKKLSGKIL